MNKQEFMANGGVTGYVWDNQGKILYPATFIAGVLADRFIPRMVYNFQETGRQRAAALYKESTKALLLELGIGAPAKAAVTQDASIEQKEYRMLDEMMQMLKGYGERIARLEGKTETKPGESS